MKKTTFLEITIDVDNKDSELCGDCEYLTFETSYFCDLFKRKNAFCIFSGIRNEECIEAFGG